MNEIKNCLHVFFLEKPGYSISELTVYTVIPTLDEFNQKKIKLSR